MRRLTISSSTLALAVGVLGSTRCKPDCVEEWRPVVGAEGMYEVSKCGRVRSVHMRQIVRSDGRVQRRPGKVLAPYLGNNLWVNISADSRRVHVMVLEAFVGPRPPGDIHGCHGDGDPWNNHVANLRWDTRSANAHDTVKHGTHPQARKVICLRGHRLVEPNLMPSASANGWRGCLACSRGHTTVRHARNRGGVDLNLQAEADLHYAAIMGGTTR